MRSALHGVPARCGAVVLLALLALACQKAPPSAESSAQPAAKPAASADKAPASDGAPAAPGGTPKLEVAQSEVNLGDVKQGEKATHVFTLKNVGTGVLHIDRAKGS
jgi:hypothetical protein